MRLLVKIDESDIRYGVQSNIEMNPAANALRRYLDNGWDCQVTDHEIVLYQGFGTRHRFRAPAAVTRCLMEFDQTGQCAPLEFEFIVELSVQTAFAAQADLLPT